MDPVKDVKDAKDVSEKPKIEEASTPDAESSSAVVTPWEVSGIVDYDELIKQFGTEVFDDGLKEKFERVTGHKLHPWIRREIFFTHRSLHQFLDAYENGEPVFLYTGRGPTTDSMHIGHLVPFMMLAWLQKVFNCPMVIQISDEEKYYFKSMEFDEIYRMGFENAKDIIACGFIPEKTFIFSNRDHRLKTKEYEIFASTMKKKISLGTVQKIFGFNNDSTVGMVDWPFYQSAAAFSRGFPHIFGGKPAHCLIPYAIDQDPYFRMARDIAPKMNLLKPCSIICTFIPPLVGVKGKMSSSSDKQYSIFLTDSKEEIREKVMKYAYSAGGTTIEDHKRDGGRPDEDVSFQYLRYFEFDDDKLEDIRLRFKSGEYLCGDVKEKLIEKLTALIASHQEARANVSEETIREYYSYHPMDLPVPKKVPELAQETDLYKALDALDIKHSTLYHSVITTMDEGIELSAKVEGVLCKNILLKGTAGAYYLYVLNTTTMVNMKTLPKRLGIKKLRFAERNAVHDVLQVPQGCVTVFALINDKAKKVTVVLDETIPKEGYVNFHPLRNDATTTISYGDMLKFLTKYEHEPTLMTE